MPDISVNKELWDGQYHWDDGGDEWSAAWGGPSAQWHGTILPRIQNLISGGPILEIACGYGRWSQFLEKQCNELVLVELSERCLEACKTRFREQSHISYHLTDGKSLDMASDNSIDFVFSFDSLVHADPSVLDAYIGETSRVLSAGGSAFIHHSNLGEYGDFYRKIKAVPLLWGILKRIGFIDKRLHKRDWGVSAGVVASQARKHGLHCKSQELVQWGTKRAFIDCFTVLEKSKTSSGRGTRVNRNAGFANEVAMCRKLSELYSAQ